MSSKHRAEAIIGLIGWSVSLAIIVTSVILCPRKVVDSSNSVNQLPYILTAIVGVAASYIFYFWGCSHLTKAKGQNGALLSFGIVWPFQLVIVAVLLAMDDKNRQATQTRPITNTERIVICRRNTVIGVTTGLLSVGLAILCMIFRMGVFATHDNEIVLGMFLFVVGQVSVVVGCSYWLRAKFWPEALVVIGFLPVAPFFIPVVKRVMLLLAVRNPGLFAAALLLAPMILIVVVKLLPDRSGRNEPKRRFPIRPAGE